MTYDDFKQKHDVFILKTNEKLLYQTLQEFHTFLENIIENNSFNYTGKYYISFVPKEICSEFVQATKQLGFKMTIYGTLDDAYDNEAKLYFQVE